MPVLPPFKREEIRAAGKASVRLIKTASFLEGAKTFGAEESNAIALFMLHQATELTIRALIQGLTGSEVKQHGIHTLEKHLRHCAPRGKQRIPG